MTAAYPTGPVVIEPQATPTMCYVAEEARWVLELDGAAAVWLAPEQARALVDDYLRWSLEPLDPDDPAA